MNDVIDICKVEGSVEIDGAEINEKNVDVVTLREKVGMVFQKPNPFPKSIYDNIQKLKITFHHVRSHTNKNDIHSIGNSRADSLATKCVYDYLNRKTRIIDDEL